MRRCRPPGRTCSGCKELSGFEKIVAPFDGVVTARNTDIGQLISAGENTGPALFRVADMRACACTCAFRRPMPPP